MATVYGRMVSVMAHYVITSQPVVSRRPPNYNQNALLLPLIMADRVVAVIATRESAQ